MAKGSDVEYLAGELLVDLIEVQGEALGYLEL